MIRNIKLFSIRKAVFLRCSFVHMLLMTITNIKQSRPNKKVFVISPRYRYSRWFLGSFLRCQCAILWKNWANGDRPRCVACFLKVYVVICDVLLCYSFGPLMEIRRNSIAFIDFHFVGIGLEMLSNKFLYIHHNRE